VEAIISSQLPEKFAIVIDGWSKASTHFVALIAAYPSDNDNGYSTVLLAFSPLHDETEFTAKAHYEFVKWVLESVYNKSMDNIVAIIGDNCETNKAMCDLCELPFIGCASHRFNLAVKNWLEKYEPVLNKVNVLMGKLKNLKLSGALRRVTDLRPVQRNVTRWSSTTDMVHRYLKLKPFFVSMDDSVELVDYWPSARENNELLELDIVFGKLNSVTKALQRESINLADVRTLFDEVIKIHPIMIKYLANNAKIVHSQNFENGVVKIIDGKEEDLSAAEINCLKKLKTQSQSNVTVSDEGRDSCIDDFAASLLKKRKVEKLNVKTYQDCRFLLPTSNIVERFFSEAGFAFSDLRQSILPLNLEMQLFLKVNKSLWSKEVLMSVMNDNIQQEICLVDE